MNDDDDFDDLMERTGVFDRVELMNAVAPPSRQRTHMLVRMEGSDVGQIFTLKANEVRVDATRKTTSSSRRKG